MNRLAVPPISLILAFATSPAVAQDDPAPVDARHFQPLDYTVTAEVDVQRLIETPLFAALERSLGGLLLRQFEKELGFAFEELDRVQWAMREDFDEVPEDDPAVRRGVRRQVSTTILRGTAAVSAAALPEALGEPVGASLAAHGVSGRVRSGTAWLQVAEGVVVRCEESWAERVLAGERRGGVPVPRLTALTAGPRPIARVVGLLPPAEVLARGGMSPVPDEWYDRESPPIAVGLQLEAGEGGALRLALRLTFAPDQVAGRDACLSRIRGALDGMADAGLPPDLLPVIQAIELGSDRSDVVASLPIPADGGAVLKAAPFLFMTVGVASEREPEVGVSEAPAEAGRTEPARGGEDKRKDGDRSPDHQR